MISHSSTRFYRDAMGLESIQRFTAAHLNHSAAKNKIEPHCVSLSTPSPNLDILANAEAASTYHVQVPY